MPTERTILVYRFRELSDKAKEKAHDKWSNDGWEFPWESDWQHTLKEFADDFPIEITDWEVSTSRHSYVDLTFTGSDELAEISGIRLMAHLYHNHFSSLFRGRYYSLWSKTDRNPHWTEDGSAPRGALKLRHSKVMFDSQACVLTGYMADENILEPMYAFLKEPDPKMTYEALLRQCLDSWVSGYAEDMEYCSSMEYFADEAEANEYEFDINGNRI
jgi:hypothetical protein